MARPKTKTTYERSDGTKVTRPATRRGWGRIKLLPSKRYRASYTFNGREYAAPETFATKTDAEAWLDARRHEITEGSWTPSSGHRKHQVQAARALTFGDYAERWLAQRELRPRTRYDYQGYLDRFILPKFADRPLIDITPDEIAAWYANLCPDRPTQRANVYGCARAIFAEAERQELIDRNPARVRKGSSKQRAHEITVASPAEVAAIYEAMPPRLALAILLAGWCGLRSGELRELRRSDVHIDEVHRGDVAIHGNDATLKIRRGVVAVPKVGRVVGPPKTEAGIRDVPVPPELVPAIRAHLDEFVAPGADALLFPNSMGTSLDPKSFWETFNRARHIAGRPDLKLHDLRHTAGTTAMQLGATMAEVMAFLGHSTPSAAMRYQHATKERSRLIAQRMGALVAASATPAIDGGELRVTAQ